MIQNPKMPGGNTLYYGDNLRILRDHIADESVDLVYLDPPFNSNASYNVLFKAPDGHQSQAQIEAFDDTWHWTETAEQAFDEVMRSGNSDAATMLHAIRAFLGENDMMAYLAMMAVRLIELHRALKPTGSLYLHCDPTASHYLKILLDAVFGATNFRNDIIWKRQSAHSDAKSKFASISDNILFYVRSPQSKFNVVYQKHDPEYLEKFYRFKDLSGRRFRLSDMSAPEGGGMAAINKKTGKSNGWYIYKGYHPPARGRRYSFETMSKLDAEGRIHFPDSIDKRLQLKRYLDENEGQVVSNVWSDIQPLHGAAREALGYPTQKPVALLERILAASSNPGDVVLDPFCGCGTTLHAAAKLERRWIGIDVTHLAIGLIKRRLNEAFPTMPFEVVGVPKDLGGAQALALADKYEFQKWALSQIQAQPYKGGKKGGDGGVDGYLYFKPDGKKTEKAIVSVKGGQSLNPAMIKDLIVTVDQEGAKMGIFLTLEPPTKGMVSQAAAAGFYVTDYGSFPKIQIVTVEQLFQPSNPLRIPWQDTSVFKETKREKPDLQTKLDL